MYNIPAYGVTNILLNRTHVKQWPNIMVSTYIFHDEHVG